MERIRIDELVHQHEARTGHKPDMQALMDRLFADDIGKGPHGGEPLSSGHQRVLLVAWNRGQKLTRLQPRHILRIAEFFGVERVRDVIQERRPACDEQGGGVPSPVSNRSPRKLAITKRQHLNPEEGD